MLSPEYLDNLPQSLADLYSELETFILTDIARRLKVAGQATSTAEWQKQQAQLFSINNINQKVAQILKQSNEKIDNMMNDATKETIDSENAIYKKAGYDIITLSESKALQNYLKTAIKNTKGDVENITQSLGFAEVQDGKIVYNDIAKFYQKELNVAHIKIASGVQDYNTAIKQAANKIAESGVRTISYNNGNKYSINIDSAARRAVLTSVHQFNQETTNYMMDELVPKEKQLAEVSAHWPCRPTHADWQGQVYRVHGSDEEYENLEEATDLGSVSGLMGANCKHSYYAFVEGVSVRSYTDDELKERNTNANRKREYSGNGKSYTEYEATQYQRDIENQIRKLKRENQIYQETGLDKELKANNSKMKDLRSEYKTFSNEMNIPLKMNRAQI